MHFWYYCVTDKIFNAVLAVYSIDFNWPLVFLLLMAVAAKCYNKDSKTEKYAQNQILMIHSAQINMRIISYYNLINRALVVHGHIVAMFMILEVADRQTFTFLGRKPFFLISLFSLEQYRDS